MCDIRRRWFQSFIILSLATSVACLTDDAVSASIGTTRAMAPRNLTNSNITVPGFGGCFDTDTDRLTCSIGPDKCPANTNYLRPDEMTTIGKCDSPFRVEIGRCASESGNLDSCSPFASACEVPSKFVTSDPTCSLVEDKSVRSDMITHYPFCRVKAEIDEKQPTRCILSDDECIAGREDFLPFQKATNIARCFCSDVPIGICSKKDTTPITMESSFCAVADYDCPDEYEFMPAYELSDMDSPPRKCRLCKMENLLEYNLHQDVVKSGRCVSEDGDYGLCALESTDCNTVENETFQSSAELSTASAMSCHTNHFSGGECTNNADDGEVHCTNYNDACETPSAFVPRATCTMFSDSTSPNDEPMYFGQCRKKLDSTNLDERGYRCVWNRSECNETEEEWVPASKPMDWYDECKCEDVETGACDDNGNYYCAVSSDACAATDTYVPSLETKDKGIKCHLCQRSRIPKTPTTPPSNKSSSSPTSNPTRRATYSPTDKNETNSPTPDTEPPTWMYATLTPTDTNTESPTTAEWKEYMDEDDTFDDDGDAIADDDDLDDDDILFEDDIDDDYLDDDYLDDDADDDDYLDDNVDGYDDDEIVNSHERSDLILILFGTIGGTLFFTCVAVIFHYQQPLPIKLHLTEKEVPNKGYVV